MPVAQSLSTPVRHGQHTEAVSVVPAVRVIIPAFRAGSTIRDVVRAVLASQACGPLQVVVVDDGCNDGLAERLRGLPVEIVDSARSGSAAAARNRGARAFEGEWLVFIDADVVVDRFCIARLLEPLQHGSADATVGNYSRNVTGTTFASRYKQLYISRIYERRSGYLQNDYWSAACAIDATVFESLKGFDTRFRGACGEDVELGHRLTSSGYRILAVPKAIADHRNVLSLTQLVRNDFRKGVMAMRTHLDCDGTIVDNRHSTARDVRAVAAAAAILMQFPFMPLAHSAVLASAIFAALAVFYLGARWDVLNVFASQGVWFSVRACALMYLLDVVRCACVVAAVCIRFAGRKLLPNRAGEGTSSG